MIFLHIGEIWGKIRDFFSCSPLFFVYFSFCVYFFIFFIFFFLDLLFYLPYNKVVSKKNNGRGASENLTNGITKRIKKMKDIKNIHHKKVELGKVDYYEINKKNCLVEIEIELREQTNGRHELSICGKVWNAKKTDCVRAGQCLDSIKDLYLDQFTDENKKIFYKLFIWWKLYHLNGMHAGTEEQEIALTLAGIKNYTDATEFLKSVGLYNVRGYEYGSGWLHREIPAETLQEIKNFINK